MMPVSSAISRRAASAAVSWPSRCPLGRHHSRRPARLMRAMIATSRVEVSKSTTTPPAEVSSVVEVRTGKGPGFGILGVGVGRDMPSTLTGCSGDPLR